MRIIYYKPAQITAFGGTELRDWQEAQREFVKGSEYTKAYKRGHWDGYYRPGTKKYLGDGEYALTATPGLLDRLLQDFPDADIEYKCDEPPEIVLEEDSRWDVEKLRDYQRKSIDMVLSKRFGRVALATNAGKGAIIGILAARLAEEGRKTIILADQQSVFDALLEEIKKWGKVTPDLVEAGRDDPPAGDVVLGMIPTLYNRTDSEEWQEWLGTFDMALLDEADRATSKSWKTVIRCLENTHWRAGFSGSFDTHTPKDQLEQEELMGPVRIWVKNEELVRRGISAKPTVEIHKYQQYLSNLPPESEWYDWTGPERRRWTYEAGVMYNEDRNNHISDIVDPDVPTAIFVRRVEHGKLLADEFLDDAEFLYGEDSKESRRDTLERFMNGEFSTLACTAILTRGTNLIKHVKQFIIAASEGSETQILQSIGRGLRKAENKDSVRVVDIMDVGPQYGERRNIDPYEYFERAARKRLKVYNQENFDVEILD